MTAIETRISRAHGLIVVEARVRGPGGDVDVALALDTGSTETVINPWVVDALGYTVRDGEPHLRVAPISG